MNVLIVGLGSMGKRRARLTARLRKDAKLFGVDKAESRRAEAKALGVEAFASLDEALDRSQRAAELWCDRDHRHQLGHLQDGLKRTVVGVADRGGVLGSGLRER